MFLFKFLNCLSSQVTPNFKPSHLFVSKNISESSNWAAKKAYEEPIQRRERTRIGERVFSRRTRWRHDWSHRLEKIVVQVSRAKSDKSSRSQNSWPSLLMKYGHFAGKWVVPYYAVVSLSRCRDYITAL